MEATQTSGQPTQDAAIPIIDISGDGDQEQVARELVDAAVQHGFVYIKSTGKDIPAQAIDGAFSLAEKLFKAPLEEKQSCNIQKNNRGYSGMHVETLDPKNQRIGDLKEAFNFGEFVNGKAQQPLPPTIAGDEPQIAEFFAYCHQLSLKLNSLLGIGLGVDPPTFFQQAHLPSKGPSGTILRLLRYPPLSALTQDTTAAASKEAASAADVRAGAHSDYGSLTLLFRLAGQPGLEVQQILPSGARAWAPVPVVPPGTESDPSPPVLVNIGDLLSYWTGGLLRSTLHRVVFPRQEQADQKKAEEPRYSIAFFCHPVGSFPLEPVPSERVQAFAAAQQRKSGGAGGDEGEGGESNPYAERKVLTADEHLQMRLRASYLDLYDDSQDSGGQKA